MKHKLLLASSLLVSIASVAGVASAAEDTGYPYPYPPERFTYVEHCNQKLDRPHHRYVVKHDITCQRDDFNHVAAEEFPGHPKPPKVKYGILITADNVELDLNGKEIKAHFELEETETAGYPYPYPYPPKPDNKVDIGIWVQGNDAHVFNGHATDEAELEYFLTGVLAEGDRGEFDGIEVEEGDVGFQVLGSDNFFIDNISEENRFEGFLVGHSDRHEGDHHYGSISGNNFRYNAAIDNGAEGFLITGNPDDHLMADPNFDHVTVLAFNSVSGGEHGILVKESIGNALLFNAVSHTRDAGIEIEFVDGFAHNEHGITNAVIANNVFVNAEGLEVEGSKGTLLAFNFAIENEEFDLLDTDRNCRDNFWVNNHAEIDKVDPSCTLDRSDEFAELIAEYKALAN
jgi:hypothetical protein